jgi:two-component system sensor histidine kinase/response regulator
VAVAVIDVQMPGMDGFEMAQLMRGTEKTRTIPIVFVTAGSRDQRRTFEGYSVGAVDFLYKPIDGSILRSKVDVFGQLHRQRLQLARQLQISQEMLRLNELLTAVIGHDLRNPLNAVIAGADIVLRQSTEETSRWAAERIRSGSVRMAKLIEELLDFSNVRLRGTPGECDLLEAARKIVSELELANSTQIVLEHVGNLRGLWDQERMCQLLSNLIGNALIHGRSGVQVAVRLDGRDADHVVLSVANDGAIAAAMLPFIFDPFKPYSRRTRSSGLGLGLYIVDHIVKAHKGSIAVESTETTGTKFTVKLPRRLQVSSP